MLTLRAQERAIASAVEHFWQTREVQSQKQQSIGRSDRGGRSAVTAGRQMDGFVDLVRRVVVAAGLSEKCIHTSKSLELPGYFRPEKKWDLTVVDDDVLIAAVEFKSQIGPSFGNNFNNRSEEAIGTAQDLWTAYREGTFPHSHRPWLGYLMLLEDCHQSTSAVTVRQPHFAVFPEFIDASYSERYQLLLTRLVRERLYDSACFLLSSKSVSRSYSFPDPNLSFFQMAGSLSGRINAYLNSGWVRGSRWVCSVVLLCKYWFQWVCR
jgi:hypothetical protein